MSGPIVVISLPQSTTAFVGRERELADIAARFGDPACRLLSLVGPGGAGKTRLAIEAARAYAEFRDGEVYFAALDELSEPSELPLGIARAINVPLVERERALDQIARALEGRPVLLVLDNFEHLVDEAPLLGEILARCGGVRLLVTSRVMLNLAEEWVTPIDGLDCAAQGEAERLFVERARRVNPELDATACAGASRICRLVGGMPLAIEIAASWTRTLTCDAVADEIERSLAFLAGGARNIPPRHRSVVAVFDQSWQRLTAAERDAFLRLSVFDGGFTREAARAVADATLSVLASLVEQCLIRHDANGRYRMHELVRQYGREKLAVVPGELDRALDSHALYFLRYLSARRGAIAGAYPGQLRTVEEIESELANIKTAWEWGLRQQWWDHIETACYALRMAFEFRGRYLEAFETVGTGLERVGEPATREGRSVRALLLVSRTWLHVRFGRIDEAEADAAALESLGMAYGVDYPPGLGADGSSVRALIALVRGNYEEALAHSSAARARAAALESDYEGLMTALYLAASANIGLGRYDDGRKCAEQACELGQENGNRWFEAYPRGELGRIARATGDYAAAGTAFAACYELRKEFDDPEGMAVALANMAGLALLRNEPEDAERMYRSALQLYRRAADRGGIAWVGAGLAACALAAGDPPGCRSRLHDALATARAMDYGLVMIQGLLTGAELSWQRGEVEKSVEILAAIAASGRANQEQVAQIDRLLAMSQGRLGPALLSEARRRGAARTLDEAAGIVLASLRVSSDSAAQEVPGLDLTPRELDVVRLLAEGHTNVEIAGTLEVTAGTVKWYTSQIFSKLEVKNRTAAVTKARELGIVG